MQIKRAILTVLATRPDGRARLDAELKDEVGALTANEDQPGDPSCSLDDIDIFQSGLVIPEDGGVADHQRWPICVPESAGRPRQSHPLDLPPTRGAHIRLPKNDGRFSIFELRSAEVDFSPEGAELEDASSMSARPAAWETDTDLPPEGIAQSTPHEAGYAYLQGSEPITVVAPDSMPADALGFLVRDASGSEVSAPERERPWRSRLSRLISAKHQQALAIWRRHLEQDAPDVKAGPRRTGNVSGAAIALLSLLTIVICAGAVIVLIQIRSLKSEVATLQRELSPLRERAARADLLEKAKQNADQQKESPNKSGAEKNRAEAEPAGLNLTPEEIRLIRDFIKPAPAAATPATAIIVGDTVGIATIPLPSQLMEKIPRLLGARFTTRNGSIIILRRDSRQADAVL